MYVLTELCFATTFLDFAFNSVWFGTLLCYEKENIIHNMFLDFGKEEIKKYLVHGLKVVQSHVVLIRGLAGTIDVDKG